MLNKRLNSRTGLLFSIICFVSAVFLNHFSTSTIEDLRGKTENSLRAKEEHALEQFDLMNGMLEKSKPAKLFDFFEGTIADLYHRDGIALFVYEKDSLKFWTTNQVALELKAWTPDKDNGLAHLRNGWYEYFFKKKDELRMFCLMLIKPDYDVQNSYLDNSFVDWLHLPKTVQLKYPASDKGKEIHSIKGESLFEIATEEPFVYDQGIQNWSLFFFLLGVIVCVISGLKTATKKEFGHLQFLILIVVLVLLRIIMIYFKWPGFLYQTGLFDLGTYGNSGSFFNGFLGDILFNSILFFCLAFIFYKKFELRSRRFIGAALLCLLVILLLLSFHFNSILKSLVSDSSNISFEFVNIFNLNWLSFLCLAIVFIYGLAILVLVEKCINWLYDFDHHRRQIFIVVFNILYFAIGIFILRSNYTFVECFWLLILFDLALFLKRIGSQKSLIGAGVRLIVFSILISFLFGRYNSIEEKQDVQIMSDELSDRQDPILENKFEKISKKILSDKKLVTALGNLPLYSSEIEQQIRQTYFKGYFEKYSVQLALFDSVCMPCFKNSDQWLTEKENLEVQIQEALPVNENFYFIENYKPNSRYIGKLEFDHSVRATWQLYVLLEPKLIADEGSFPDLLLEKYQQKKSQYRQFSYAIYKQNRLTNSYGDFDYPLYYGSESAINVLSSDFKHYFSSPDNFTKIVLTTRNKDFQYYFTLNSYYFLFFSILGLLGFLVYSAMNNRLGLFSSLSRRIQLFIVSILFFALLAVGVFSIRLVTSKFEDDNIKALSDKTKRITAELTPLLFNSKTLNVSGTSYAESVLVKYAGLFKTDISLYDVNGHLFASSQPQLFELGLSSKLINPGVIANFGRTKGSHFNIPDNIGFLKYLSFYAAVYNPEGKFLGYMNLPYFARQSHFEKELSDYITTLLNIYVVLFIVSLFTGLIVTAYITKPLRIVQQQLAKISLNKKNEPIFWRSNDEIGKLVSEYNLMLLKLEDSATLLARSEREGAWREMAKQVAHEIKNPLTPMKLNLQYLQKLSTENNDDFKNRFKPISASIIEQIDTLAHIASEFSNFAKMPKATLERVNLNEVIESSIHLFKNAENASVQFNSTLENYFVKADKEQSLRVFNNLIKNAVQSIPDTRKGLIEIEMTSEDDSVLVSVKDNGCGISETMREKIFVPNFTTKSTGTGLGLAMVKNIITSAGGEIWFESKENTGTVFYVRFVKVA